MLATVGERRKSILFRQEQGIFAQGDAADAVFYIQTGKVKLTVVSKTGKEATVSYTHLDVYKRQERAGRVFSRVRTWLRDADAVRRLSLIHI